MLNLSNVVWVTFIIFKITFCQSYGLPSGDVCLDFTENPNSEFAKDCYQNLDECQQVMQLLRKGIGCDPECGERERCVMVHGKLQCNCTEGFQGKDCSIKIVCANQSAPDNGQVTCDDGENLNSTCTFNCDVGYRLDGNHATTCIDDNNGDALGIWNNEAPMCREFIELDDGWVSPFNGFQYKYVETRQDWTIARATCHNMGGDLASFGIRNIETRRILVNALNIDQLVWIGLNDISSEGTWKYITSFPSNDGDLATNSTALWADGQPYAFTDDYDCAYMNYFNQLSYSYYCGAILYFYFLCEKPV